MAAAQVVSVTDGIFREVGRTATTVRAYQLPNWTGSVSVLNDTGSAGSIELAWTGADADASFATASLVTIIAAGAAVSELTIKRSPGAAVVLYIRDQNAGATTFTIICGRTKK